MISAHTEKPGCFFCNPIFADDLFFGLSSQTLQSLESVKQKKHFPADTTVIEAEDLPSCIYILTEGKAEIHLDSESHAWENVRLAEPQEIIGLSETLACFPYDMTVKTITACTFEQIERKELIRLLSHEAELGFRLVQLLGLSLQKSCFPSFQF